MTRRSRITDSQRIDLAQRRRTRGNDMYSEQPIALDVRRLSGGGEGGGAGPIETVAVNSSWLSPDASWTDPRLSWLA
jgi:hypothetical protein